MLPENPIKARPHSHPNLAHSITTEVVYEAVVLSLEEHAVNPQYTERMQNLLKYFAESAVVTGAFFVFFFYSGSGRLGPWVCVVCI